MQINCQLQLSACSRPLLAVELALSLVSSLYLFIAFCLSVAQLICLHDHSPSFISQENAKINLTTLVVTEDYLKPLGEWRKIKLQNWKQLKILSPRALCLTIYVESTFPSQGHFYYVFCPFFKESWKSFKIRSYFTSKELAFLLLQREL